MAKKKDNKVKKNTKVNTKGSGAALALKIEQLENNAAKEQDEAKKKVLLQQITNLKSQLSQALEGDDYMELDRPTETDSESKAGDEEADGGKGDAGKREGEAGGEPSAGSAKSHKTNEANSSPQPDQAPAQDKKVKIETVEGEGLFVSDHENVETFDVDGLTPLGSMSVSQPVKGGETVGWGNQGNRTFYINRYGEKKCCIYRLEPDASSEAYEDNNLDSKVTLQKNRFGDLKTKDGKWKYTARHIKNVFGVAWDVSKDPENPLSLLDPKVIEKGRFPATYILIEWDLGDKLEKTWETRTCLRIRWKKQRADQDIYKLAAEAQQHYEGVQSGRIEAPSRSLSRALGEERTRELRMRPSPFQTASPSPVPRASVSDPKISEELATALQLYGVAYKRREEDMSEQEKMAFIVNFMNSKRMLSA